MGSAPEKGQNSVDEQPLKSPGEVIRELLVDRGWTQTDLARVLDRSVSTVNEIIQGKQSITPEIAQALAAAFFNEPQYWISLEGNYQIATSKLSVDGVRRRSSLFDIAPVKEMEKRGWIKKTASADELEAELCRFFGQSDLSQPPSFPISTRRANTATGDLSPLQRAWCFRARKLASEQITPPFDPAGLDECEDKLRRLTTHAPEVRKVASIMHDFGIRFVIIEPLPSAKIDGAAFWIDDTPAIAVSLRHDRIDSFWFTVFHEWSHIRHEDAFSIDSNLVGDDAAPSAEKSPVERRADSDASEMLIPQERIQSFIHRVAPLYSKARIVQFAHRNKVHPGIVVGQLQHRGQIGFHANREMLVKIRDIAISTALVDGWGHTIS